MTNSLEVLFLRRPKFDYISPAICGAIFSSSSGPVIVLNPLTPQTFPTGLILGGAGGFQLSWDAYPGALCYSVYKADSDDPFGSYTIIAECIPSPTFNIEAFGRGCYRVSAITHNGETPLSLPDCTPTTPPQPTATTDPADNISSNSAQLHGRATPNGDNTNAFFQWGLTTAYGNTTTPTAIGAGFADVPFSFLLVGLNALSQYHFRAVASNVNGTVHGVDRVFSTTGIIPSPLWNITWDDAIVNPGNPPATTSATTTPNSFHMDIHQGAIGFLGTGATLIQNGHQTYTGPQVNCNLHLVITNSAGNSIYSYDIQVDGSSVSAGSTTANAGTYDFPFVIPASVGALITISVNAGSGSLFNPSGETLDGTLQVI